MRMVIWKCSLGLLAIACLTLGGRYLLESPTERFQNALQEARTCTDVSQCSVLYTECPLGCYHAVATTHLPELSTMAEELVTAYRETDKVCAYDCLAPPPLICVAGQCTFATDDRE